MADNCQKNEPKLPKNGIDGQEICDNYGNIWQYDSKSKTWIAKGVILTPKIFIHHYLNLSMIKQFI